MNNINNDDIEYSENEKLEIDHLIDEYEKEVFDDSCLSDGSFSYFISQIKQYKRIPWEEQLELLREYKETKDEKIRNILILCNLGLVIFFAKRFIGRGLDIDELTQEGIIGVMKAIDKFDESRNCKLSTYSAIWIKQSMGRAIDNQSKTIRIPVHRVTMNTKIYNFINSYIEKYGHIPSNDEIADNLNIPVTSIVESLASQQLGCLSLNRTVDNESDTEFADLLTSEKNNIEEIESYIDDKILCHQCRSILTPRQYYIIYYRYLHSVPLTLNELGKDLKVTRVRINQIESSASFINTIKYRYLNNSLSKFLCNISIKHIIERDYTPTRIPTAVRYAFLERELSSDMYQLFVDVTSVKLSKEELEEKYSNSYKEIINIIKKIINKYYNLLFDENSDEYKDAFSKMMKNSHIYFYEINPEKRNKKDSYVRKLSK